MRYRQSQHPQAYVLVRGCSALREQSHLQFTQTPLILSYDLSLIYDKGVYFDLIWSTAKSQRSVATFLSFLVMRCDSALYSSGLALDYGGEACHVHAE